MIERNPQNFRLFGPDETVSNRLGAVFETTDRAWTAATIPSDDHLSPDGRVMEVLSEHLCQGRLEGYILTGRHGLFNCYEAFIHIIDSMFNQHAKMAQNHPGQSPGAARRQHPPLGDRPCLRSRHYVNVIVAGKQPALQYLSMEEAILHCTRGIGIWEWASNEEDGEPDVVMACCGDVPTLETLAAVDLIRQHLPQAQGPGDQRH